MNTLHHGLFKGWQAAKYCQYFNLFRLVTKIIFRKQKKKSVVQDVFFLPQLLPLNKKCYKFAAN